MVIFRKQIFIFFGLLIFSFFLTLNLGSSEVKIIAKIENEIITNVDIENEYIYLISLNTNLQNIEKKKVLKFAKESLIKEKIKQINLLQYVELNKKNEMIDVMIKNIYQNIGINSESEFKNYLRNLNLDFNEVYKKIEIEALWNQMIFSKYRKKIIINKEKLKKKIEDNPKKIETFLLSEIIFDFKSQSEIKKKYLEILKSVESIGFKETVINYSIADSKNKFGSIGWVNKNALSNTIKDSLKGLNIGEITEPIIIPSGALIIKIDNKKLKELNTNLDEELKKIIQFETNRQLNNYSTLYYNKIKNKLSINEY